jgi:hypothetical protein
VAVTSSASFAGGLLGTWSISYASGAPDLFLQKVTIDLGPANLAFDTYAGGTFGSLTAQDIGGTSFTGSGTPSVSGISATGQALDGGSVVTFSFLDFTPGNVFHFSADVDRPNPTLLPLLTCGRWDVVCALTNLDRTATNDANLLQAQLAFSNQMAGATVTFQFGGLNYNTAGVQATFPVVTLLDVILGLAQGQGLVAFNANAGTSADVTTPEPSSLVTFGAGMGLLLALARRRRA